MNKSKFTLLAADRYLNSTNADQMPSGAPGSNALHNIGGGI